MKKKRTAKEIAGRIDPTYHRHVHPLRRTRTLLSAAACAIGLFWVVLGGDGLHANGAVASAHAPFQDNCAACHAGDFDAVPDPLCTACHAAADHHESKAAGPSCASCHRDHRGRDGLRVVSDAHCNTCHGEHRDIVGFSSHVEFAVQPADQHLRFNHKKHLDPKLQEGPLDCASCHVARGRGHQPIEFDTHCARCHTERIDDEFPEETVPHGFPAAKMRDWVGVVYLRHGVVDSERVAGATAALFDPERERGCLLCHSMEEGEIVAPAVPESWMKKARFDHHPHRTMKCAACHEMARNEKASELRLPGIATCRECHTQKAAPARCTTCHAYHTGATPAK